jgi:hypothetical protein
VISSVLVHQLADELHKLTNRERDHGGLFKRLMLLLIEGVAWVEKVIGAVRSVRAGETSECHGELS